jgi:tetratricopeptide (TPR) repeat protein
MKQTNLTSTVILLLLLLSSNLSRAQGNITYHYIIPPELGDRLQDVKKLAFMEFTYTPPAIPGQNESAGEQMSTDQQLVQLMLEKERKELMGPEAYAKWKASQAGGGDGGSSMGGALASNITSILIIPDRGKSSGAEFFLEGIRTDPYTIVDRADIDRILNEQQFQLSGVVDGQQMSEIGALLGADAIINGDLASTSTDSKLPEKIEKVYRSEKYTDDKGKQRTRQVFNYNRYHYSVQRTVTSTFSITVTSVKTGQILGSKNYTAKSSSTKTNSFDRNRPPDSKKYPSFEQLEPISALVRKTVNPLSRSAADYLQPRFGTTTQKISKVKAKEFKQIAKEAADYLKDGRIDKAYAIYQTIYDADPYISESAFNVGMIYEIAGQYDKALEKYQGALEVAVKNSNEKKYDEAVDRTKNSVIVMDQLNSLGIELVKKGFSADAAESLMADKVTTKGNPKKDRWEVYESADPTSPVIGKVPGGREFPSFEVEGNYTLIEILGGKRGYISNLNIK